ncbi:MAG: leucyl/phenylalanyl-tRNA--protein transferase [Candidatus Muproteobacteria bacterium RBG_16_64_11]|uniref:Leucyl/phenylalanyl-tRNA--protein transferase n=1 Tax=Candidatus Muproteobacteria bacterium RBG_16_64_11 TaxID=1817758 RepID=A0A1F6TFJ4_9PROT|nr:MAG: leucyl/phenylalanyl-tRNA--protein transferase [Candidatus Muproteobacteria bacterium RBG_16_64_11]
MNLLRPGTNDLRFPPVETSTPEGLVAVGGDLRPERLLAAYRHGIFPWYGADQPILWWSPDPRTVLFPAKLKIARSLRKTLRQGKFRVTLDQAFDTVMRACAGPRGDQPSGTWITPAMHEAYVRLHALGHAHSVEAWDDGQLVGGLYGVALGAAFFGESMFSRATDASKVAFVHLVRQLEAWGYALVDCQVASAHLFSLGAEEIPRTDFLAQLAAALARPGRPAPWRFDSDLEVA